MSKDSQNDTNYKSDPILANSKAAAKKAATTQQKPVAKKPVSKTPVQNDASVANPAAKKPVSRPHNPNRTTPTGAVAKKAVTGANARPKPNPTAKKPTSPANNAPRANVATKPQATGVNGNGVVTPQKINPNAKRPQHTNNNPNANAPNKTTAKLRFNRNPISPKGTLKIIPLGGLGEIGKNITYFEYDNQAVLIDCGMAFPDDSMPGIDIVIPDFTFLIENQKKIKGLLITHGHEDHIGSVPYLLKHFNIPIYSTRLTIGLIEDKLKEHGLLRDAKLNIVKAGDTVKLGNMSGEFITVNHSIPDACAIALKTPAGVIVHTGDFKVDYTPIIGGVINLARFGELGSQGVLALLSDSTNAERSGNTASERVVGASLQSLINDAEGKRVIVATFASNLHRVQQIVDAAVKAGRKVAVSGRSMENVSSKAIELGYLKAPADTFISVDEAGSFPSEKVVIITTGSQGEPMSALTRMARGDHRKIGVTVNDCIIISASPIPGNEKGITNVINDLLRLGADVIYDRAYEIHVSGHGCADELKLMMALTKPKYFIPVHGEYKHIKRHAELAKSMGIPEKNIYLPENGHIIEVNQRGLSHKGQVQAGEVFVDGLGIGDVGNIVLRDRMHLSEDGLIVVISAISRATGKIISGPDIVSRGFVYVRESEDLINKSKQIARKSIENNIKDGKREWNNIKNGVRDDVGDYLWQSIKRRPMILPVIQEVK